MLSKKTIVLGLLFCSSVIAFAQDSFENSLIYKRRNKLFPLYNELMDNALSIKVTDENNQRVVASPSENLKGEATFVYEIGDNDNLTNVYMTEFWCYSTVNGDITVKDYIIFVDVLIIQFCVMES